MFEWRNSFHSTTHVPHQKSHRGIPRGTPKNYIIFMNMKNRKAPLLFLIAQTKGKKLKIFWTHLYLKYLEMGGDLII